MSEIYRSKSDEREIDIGSIENERRRYTLLCLDRYSTPLTLADLADEVSLLQHDVRSLEEVPEREVKRIYMELYHTDIPKLEDANLITYDQKTDTIQLKEMGKFGL